MNTIVTKKRRTDNNNNRKKNNHQNVDDGYDQAHQLTRWTNALAQKRVCGGATMSSQYTYTHI